MGRSCDLIGLLVLSVVACSLVDSRVVNEAVQPPNGGVCFERLCLGPATLSSVVAQLSKATDEDLRVSRELSEEVVALCGVDLSLADALAKLADVASATWESEGPFRLLKRTAKQQQECRQRDSDSRSAQLESQLQEYSKEISRSGTPYDRAREAIRRFELMLKGESKGVWSQGPAGVVDLFLPSDVLLKRVLLAVGSKRLAELPYLETVVFSTNPTARQRAFSSSVGPLIDDYAEEQSWFVKASNEEQFSSAHPLFASWWKNLQSQPVDRTDIGKVLLSARFEGGRVWTLLQIFDTEGGNRGAAVRVMSVFHEATSQDVINAIPESAMFRPPTTHREFGRLASEPGMFVAQHLRPIEPTGLAPMVEERVAHPDQVEPLSLFLGDLCCEASRLLGRPVVARLPDSCAPVLADVRAWDGIPLRTAVSQLSQKYGVRVEEKSGWIVLSPSNDLECERARLKRSALATVMELAGTRPLLDIRAIASLHFNSGTGAFKNPIVTFYLNLLVTTGMAVDPYDIPFPLLSLIGSLTDDDWRAALKGEPVLISKSGLPTQRYYEQWCSFGAGYDMWLGPGIVQRTRRGVLDAVPDLLLSGTEALPTGVQSDSVLSILASGVSAFQKVIPLSGATGQRSPDIVFHAEHLAQYCFNMILEGEATSVADVMSGTWRILPKRQLTFLGALSQYVEIVRVYTGHPSSRADSIERVYKDFPAEEKRRLESRVSELLRLARPIRK